MLMLVERGWGTCETSKVSRVHFMRNSNTLSLPSSVGSWSGIMSPWRARYTRCIATVNSYLQCEVLYLHILKYSVEGSSYLSRLPSLSWSARSHILPNIDIGSFEPIMTFRTWAMAFFLFCTTLTLHLVSWKKTAHWLELVEESVVLSLFVRLDQEVDAEWITGDHMGEITLYEVFFTLGREFLVALQPLRPQELWQHRS